ncbi:MAG: hypothetical protein ACRCSG_04000 [Cellulosilyticaceae bacterium]
MAKYRYSKPKRRINFQAISIILLIISIMALGIVATKSYITTKNIKKTESSIVKVEKDKIILQEEILQLEESTETLEKELKRLEDLIWKYEPVIIPDSMK